MSWRNLSLQATTLFAAAALLAAAGPAAGGDNGGGIYRGRPDSGNPSPLPPPPPRRALPAPTAPAVVLVVGNQRRAPAAVSVKLRGPDGVVRTFRLEEGVRVRQPRRILVHPGETVTLRFLPAAPRR